jgi:exonuclease VII small subunit
MPTPLHSRSWSSVALRSAVTTWPSLLLLIAALSLFLASGAFARNAASRGASGGTSSSSADAGNGQTPAQASNAQAWQTYMRKLGRYVHEQPAMAAQEARVKAAQAEAGAEEGDLNLKLTGRYTYYPNGVGSGEEARFTDLKQRAEGRLSWGILGFLARRPGRIKNAKETAERHKYESKVARLSTQTALLEEEIADWAAAPERKALKRGLEKAKAAKQKLGLARQSSLAQITGATSQRVTTALNVSSQIQKRLAALPQAAPKAPQVPKDYSVLPLHAPRLAVIRKIAKNSPRVKSLRAQSKAASGKAQSYWGNDVDLSVYGGYITEKRKDQNNFKSGPEVGVVLTIPIGTAGAGKSSAANYRAKARKLQAQAAVVKQRRYLRQLRQQWAKDTAALQAQEADMERQAALLHKLEQRAQHPASGKAPEPWETNLQAAKFWLAVGQVWNKRRQWVSDTLTWALYDPSYLERFSRPSNPNVGHSLCAPLSSCEPGQS